MITVLFILAEEEQLPDGQVTGRRRLHVQSFQFAAEKLVGQLGQNAGAVAGLAVIGHCAAMGMIAQRLQGHFQHCVAATSLDVGDKANATGIVLEAGIVQSPAWAADPRAAAHPLCALSRGRLRG